MSYSPENIAELNLLMQFDTPSGLDGIKIHKNADPRAIEAAARLHDGGFITQADGGYLTQLGIEAAGHAHSLYYLLNSDAEK